MTEANIGFDCNEENLAYEISDDVPEAAACAGPENISCDVHQTGRVLLLSGGDRGVFSETSLAVKGVHAR